MPPTFKKNTFHSNLFSQAGLEARSLGPQAGVLPTEPPMLVLVYNIFMAPFRYDGRNKTKINFVDPSGFISPLRHRLFFGICFCIFWGIFWPFFAGHRTWTVSQFADGLDLCINNNNALAGQFESITFCHCLRSIYLGKIFCFYLGKIFLFLPW